jgi:uncharacterized membrane protein YkoI
MGVAALAALVVGSNALADAAHLTGDKYLPLAKISLDQARTIALKACPGAITDQELEKEKGGSGLRYSFDIKTAAGVREVGVDAVTGIVLENSREGPHPD